MNVKRILPTGIGIVLVALLGAACASQGSVTENRATGNTLAAPNPPPTPSTAPAPAPSPDGTYSGSCDYTLSNAIYGNDHLTGEVDLKNTGNIGTVNRVRISWPQEGYAPIVAHKTVRVPAGGSKVVRFHVPVASMGNVITNLQSWQERHNFRDGCHYRTTIIDTFGSVQSGS
jgi:hypothetical protein